MTAVVRPSFRLIPLVILIAVAACAPGARGTLDASTTPASAVATRAPASTTPTPGATATRVFPPTLTATDQRHLADLIAADRVCGRACYLGIVPGQTTWSQARAILETMVGEVSGTSYQSEDLPVYGVDLSVPRDGSMSAGIRHQVYVSVSGETISRIEVFVGDLGYGNLDQTDFYDLWGSYSLREVFTRYGPPDDLLVHTNEEVNLPGYGLLMLYDEAGFAMESSGQTREEYTICPQMGEGSEVLGLRISLVDPATGLDPVSPNWVPASAEIWDDVEDKLGIDAHTFYERIMTEEAPCFPLRDSQ